MAARAANTREANLRSTSVVLFGMPAAGKSSLLGALARAAQTQPGLLGGTFKDESGGLAELERRVYEDRSQETLEEIVPYPVTFDPEGGAALKASLIDCDGRIAHSYLIGERSLGATKGKVDLGQALEHADALLLIVDVSAEEAQLRRDFAQFAEFLRWLEDHRGKSAEVAGLPVYLVLTKCDLLARSKDSTAGWLERIEEAKRDICQKFKDFLAEEEQREQRPFGQIDLRVWATAVKRPALSDKPARPGEPFGVAELFRQAFASARSFETRRGLSERRLQLAIAGVVGLLAVFLLLGAVFYFTRPSSELTALENAAQTALPPENANPTDRLKGPLAERVQALDKIITHPEFSKLPQILKDKVLTARAELKSYDDLSEQFRERDLPPEKFAREESLLPFAKFLKDFSIPTEYVETWKSTDLVRGLDERRRQVASFQLKLAELEGLLRNRKLAGEGLAEDWLKIGDSIKALEAWEGRVRKYLELASPPATEAIEGVHDLTYRRLYEFRTIRELTQQWDAVKKDLAAKLKK